MNTHIKTRSVANASLALPSGTLRPDVLRPDVLHPATLLRRRLRHERAGGFTLIELLVAISIIGIIAAFLAGALFAAQESGRRSATEAMISKLHSQMAMRWEDYTTRRVGVMPLAPALAAQRDSRILAAQRVLAIQEMMRFELPDQYIDIFNPADASQPPTLTALQAIPSLNFAYRRRVSRQVVEPDAISWDEAFEKIAAANQSSECLYMIMTTGMIDESSGGEYFSDGDTGDTDGDGMLEFIDGWGRPIEWIRWPTAFISDLQPAASAENVDRDPFNPTHVDEQALISKPRPADLAWGYRLTPLIVSLGRDGSEGINFAWYDGVNTALVDNANDPYLVYGDDLQRGQVAPGEFGGSYEDNIHNHLIGTR